MHPIDETSLTKGELDDLDRRARGCVLDWAEERLFRLVGLRIAKQ